MMRLFINSLAASAGGGLTYIRNVLPRLAKRTDLQVTVALSPSLREEFRDLPEIEFLEIASPTTRRFWLEQSQLPTLIRNSNAAVLLSTGNFALRKSPVPQILLSRNSIYCSRDYYSDLIARREYRLWMETRLRAVMAKRSLRWADGTVAPSKAFADKLCRWTGISARAIYHGFDREEFFRDPTPLHPDVEAKLNRTTGALRLLFVSHYNYYRNFETLIRALPILRRTLKDRPVRLFLTCKLAPGANPGAYNPESAARLVKDVAVDDMVVELGAIPYRQLHHLYRQCDVYVTPAYAETFAHPLVEAMASGLPVVAADIAVHREICGDAAVYFERFSAEVLAKRVTDVVESKAMAERMSVAGQERSRQFSWQVHVDQLLDLARSLVTSESAAATTRRP
ncbi:MAG TPA: glycosyltransferase family 1 protein [Candidatus Sulfotelmatobacter sp.]|jgi:glycosyltransferase involved in cell wall biosynthesis